MSRSFVREAEQMRPPSSPGIAQLILCDDLAVSNVYAMKLPTARAEYRLVSIEESPPRTRILGDNGMFALLPKARQSARLLEWLGHAHGTRSDVRLAFFNVMLLVPVP
jgi:hypothetical protein